MPEMRAIRFDEFGDASVLHLVRLPMPRPEAGEVLVRVAYAPVNPVDATVRWGRFNPSKPPPTVPGQEASGTIVEGSAPGFPEGARALVRGGYGIARDGTWAEYVTARPEQLWAIPDGLDDRAAAAFGSGFLTAELVFRTVGLEPGRSLLALGAGGGVGSAVCQLGKVRGASPVIGAVSTAAKAEAAVAAGFEHVVDLSGESLADGVARITGGRGVDIAVDSVGGRMTAQAQRTLADRGVLVALGYVAGSLVEIDIQDLVRRRARIQSVSLARTPPAEVRELYEAVSADLAAGAVRPIVGPIFPLEEAARAARCLEEDRPFGKVLLRVGDPAPPDRAD